MKKLIMGIITGILIVLSSYIATAPIWYGSGDDAGLVGRWSCKGKARKLSAGKMTEIFK